MISIQQKKYDRALELLNKISNKEDNLNLVNRITASVYLYKKDWEKSLSYFQKIDNKNNFDISNNIGVALYNLGRFLEASKMFEQAITFNNKYIPAYENLAVTQKLLGNYELSISCILQGLKLMPNNNLININASLKKSAIEEEFTAITNDDEKKSKIGLTRVKFVVCLGVSTNKSFYGKNKL